MSEYLDNLLLHDFARTFYGYGRWNAPIWFVGMEEGGGNSVQVIQRRLDDWAARGREELQDLPDTGKAMGDTCWFIERPKLQRTWSILIRIAMVIDGREPTTAAIREYQKCHLGRHDGENCLVELLPLPSPSTQHWFYAAASLLPYLESRQKYCDELIPTRIAHLRQRLDTHKPRAVIFYGTAYSPHWQQIANVDFESRVGTGYGYSEHTVFAITRHPAAKGVTTAYFQQVGKQIGEMVRTRHGS
jgi:hypothetical protein